MNFHFSIFRFLFFSYLCPSIMRRNNIIINLLLLLMAGALLAVCISSITGEADRQASSTTTLHGSEQ